MRFGVVAFPGSNCDVDAFHAVSTFSAAEPVYLWHKDTDLDGVDAVILPGGFSYGDYLRCGAIARFSPIMQAVADFAAGGGLVMGICNGFQILCEAHLLPGALIRNTGLKFVCRYVDLRVENVATPFTSTCHEGDVLRIVVKHNEGNYRVDRAALAAMQAKGQIVLRYCEPDGSLSGSSSPNGALDGIAGVCNETRNVFGLMPHPENSVEAAVAGGADGRHFFQSMIDALVDRRVTA
ncbi:MAG TPA: phosphoribosylformylglycinamidine synthase subunit PurQ [Thermoleophilia bacterium]|nr:phosphoribosylformylglycinamidine synthase subunit PurQ [Thermoleophilia bacterium]